jgi:hypothetical protein
MKKYIWMRWYLVVFLTRYENIVLKFLWMNMFSVVRKSILYIKTRLIRASTACAILSLIPAYQSTVKLNPYFYLTNNSSKFWSPLILKKISGMANRSEQKR